MLQVEPRPKGDGRAPPLISERDVGRHILFQHTFDKFLRWSRQLFRLPKRAVYNFVRNVFGDIARPTFGDIKCDDAHRFIEIALR